MVNIGRKIEGRLKYETDIKIDCCAVYRLADRPCCRSVVPVLCVLLPPDCGLGHHTLLGVGLFFISYPGGSVIYLGIAFLLSPFGLQAVASAVITRLNSLNLSLRQFITS